MRIMRKTTVRYSDCFKRSSLPSLIKNNKRSLISKKTYLYFKESSQVLWNKETELTQLKTDLAAIDRRILLSITPESGAEEGEVTEQVTPMAQEQETSQEQYNTLEKQEVKSGVKVKI